MRLTVLGSGTCSWQSRRACAGFHVLTAGSSVLLDCGSGVMKRLEEAGIDYLELDAILLSHTQHPDHASDFSMLLFSLNFTARGAGFFERRKPLTVLGPPGTRAFYETLRMIHPAIAPKHFELNILEDERHDFRVDDMIIESAAVSHGDTPALGYRLTHQDTALAYSGDSAPCRTLVQLFRRAQVGIVECSVEADVLHVEGHLDARQVGQLAREADTHALLVTHVFPGNRRNVLESQIREHYSETLYFADDLQRYVIEGSSVVPAGNERAAFE